MTLDVTLHHRMASFTLDVTFQAPSGITALFGRSGAGKTTLIQAVAGLLKPDQGEIHLHGETILDTAHGIAIPVHKRRIGYVFQGTRLFPHFSVRGNLLYGRWFGKGPKDNGQIDRISELLDLGPLLDRRPSTLSGGEKQRVAIGRALLSEPRLLLMDEPLAALDAARKSEILPYLERLRDDLDVPIVYVSHDVSEVTRLATTIVALDEGQVMRDGPAAEVLADPDAFPLFGRQEAGVFVPATVTSHDAADGLSQLAFSGGTLLVPLIANPVGSRLRVRIRARDIILALEPPKGISALNVVPGTVTQISQLDGPIVDVVVRCGADDLLARITRRSLKALALVEGTPCTAILKSIAITKRDIGLLDTTRARADGLSGLR